MTAERIRKYRARKAAVEILEQNMTMEQFWKVLLIFVDYPFHTAKGLKFSYRIKENELFVDRKAKSITKVTIELAFEKVVALGTDATGPKKLGGFGVVFEGIFIIFE